MISPSGIIVSYIPYGISQKLFSLTMHEMFYSNVIRTSMTKEEVHYAVCGELSVIPVFL